VNVTVAKRSATEQELTIQLPGADLAKAFEARLNEARKNIQLPGFRPGKTPKELIRKRYSASIRNEAIDQLVEQSVRAACIQEKIQPVAPGNVEEFDAPEIGAEGDIKFKIVVEIDPEIEVKDYADLGIVQEVKELTDAEVDEALEGLRGRAAEVKEATEPSKTGDMVGATYRRIEIDGVERAITTPSFQAELGRGIAEIDAGLTGVTAGQEVSVEFTFPEDYADESSRGKSGKYEVTIDKVLTRVLPELTDDLAVKFGMADLAELKARVIKDLTANADRSGREAAWDKAIDAILEKNAIEVPKSRVNSYVEWQYKRVQQQQGGAQLPPLESLLPIWAPEAEKVLKRQRVIGWIADKEDIRASTEEVDARIAEIAGQYNIEPEEIREELKRSGRIAEVREELRGTKTLNWLIGQR
jgi:trigger factor